MAVNARGGGKRDCNFVDEMGKFYVRIRERCIIFVYYVLMDGS